MTGYDLVGKRAGRCGVAGVAMALCTIFLALGMFAADARVASVVLAGGAGALYLSQSSFWSVSLEMAGTSSGSVSGVMNMGGQIGGCAHGIGDACHCQVFRLEYAFLRRGRAMLSGRAFLALGRY